MLFNIINGGYGLRVALEELAEIRSPGSVIVLGVTEEYDPDLDKFLPHNVVLFGLTNRDQATNPKFLDVNTLNYGHFNGKGWEEKPRYQVSVKSGNDDVGDCFISCQTDAGFVVSNSGFAEHVAHFLPIKSPEHVMGPMKGDLILDYLEPPQSLVVGCMVNNPVLKEPGIINIVTPSKDEIYTESYTIPWEVGSGKFIFTPQPHKGKLSMVHEGQKPVFLEKSIYHLAWDLFTISQRREHINYSVGVVGIAQHPYTGKIFGVKIGRKGEISKYTGLDHVLNHELTGTDR